MVIAAAATGFVLEFFADKVPWVDTWWDSIHTFLRPLGAAVLGATAVGTLDPLAQVLIGLLTGSVALTSHSVKTATRVAPEVRVADLEEIEREWYRDGGRKPKKIRDSR